MVEPYRPPAFGDFGTMPWPPVVVGGPTGEVGGGSIVLDPVDSRDGRGIMEGDKTKAVESTHASIRR